MNPEQNLPEESLITQEELERLRQELVGLMERKQQIPGYQLKEDLHREVVEAVLGCQDPKELSKMIAEGRHDLDEWPTGPPPDRKIGAMIIESLGDPEKMESLGKANPEELDEMARLRDLLKSNEDDSGKFEPS